MIFRTFNPTPPLRPFIRYYWECRVEKEDLPLNQSMFPFGSFELVFNILNPPRMSRIGERTGRAQPASFCPGQFTTPFILKYNEPSVCFGVSMNAWVGNLIFGVPADQLTNRVINLDRTGQRDSLQILRKLQTRKDTVSTLESYVCKRFLQGKIDTLVQSIATSIMAEPSWLNVRSTLSKSHLTQRRIEQRFLSVTGLTMNRFVRKARFHKAVRLLQTDPSTTLTEMAHELGYYDQPHFINDFKAFTGMTPGEFVAQRSPMQSFFSSLVPIEHANSE